jgi:hypothetical protein
MFKITEDIDNRQIYLHVDKHVLLQTRAIRKAFYYIGKDLVRDAAREILKKPKHGRIYTVIIDGRTVKHQASAPGEAPANLRGDLRKSLDFNVEGSNKMEFGYREEFINRKNSPRGVVYGRALELGYEPRNLEPRPNLLPTIKRNYKNSQKHFYRMLKKYNERMDISEID